VIAAEPEHPASAEPRRATSLEEAEVPEARPDPVVDALLRLAAGILEVPAVRIALADASGALLEPWRGMALEASPLERLLCEHVVRRRERLVVQDACEDPRFAREQRIAGDAAVRGFVGLPLTLSESGGLGVLFATDPRPRALGEAQLAHLEEIAGLVVQQLSTRRRERLLRRRKTQLDAHHRFFHGSEDLNCVASLDGRFVELNARWKDVLGHSLDHLLGARFLDFVHADDQESTQRALAQITVEGRPLRQLRNRYRHVDGTYRWLEWSAQPPLAGESLIYASARDITELVEAEEELRLQNGVLTLITEAQARFIEGGATQAWWTFVLLRLLELTRSEYGFIGIIDRDDEGPFLRTKAITDISWNEDTRRFYEAHKDSGFIFRNMNTLFGRAIVLERRLIANDVEHDPRAGGRPSGHPPLRAFGGLPIREGASMVGLVGIANRPGGYSDGFLDRLEPVLALLGTILKNLVLQEERDASAANLAAVKAMQERVLESSATGYVFLRSDGSIALVNRRAKEILPELERLNIGGLGAGLGATVSWLFPLIHDQAWLLAPREPSEATQRGPRELQARGGGLQLIPVEVSVTWLPLDGSEEPGLLLTLADLRDRAVLQDTLRVNASLEERVRQLRENQTHNELLSECVELLQSSSTNAEGLEVVHRSMARLFPSANVTLYEHASGSEHLHLVARARRFIDEASVDELLPQQCWALRSRRPYGSWPDGHRPACRHSATDEDRADFCVPLFSLDRIIALLSISFPPGEPLGDQPRQDARMSQFVALGQSISGALSTIALRESLQRLALTDELTELANRRAFILETKRVLARQKRASRPVALAILDADHFKTINDSFGHEAGDRVLQQLAAVLRRSVRAGDLAARVGGEEFALLMPDLTPEAASARFESVLEAVRSGCGVHGRKVTASLGFAHSQDLGEDPTLEELYRRADAALYAAKEAGRDRVMRAPPSDEAAAAPQGRR
jgi:diguanylate cyclase (GGDEF)-like protein/PAS domain S-box-containing protein